jgi:type IV secretion system protein VirB9
MTHVRSALAISLALLSSAVAAAAPRSHKSPGDDRASIVERANSLALVEPSPSAFVQAIQVYPFAEGTVYRLYAAPERVTDIALQPGETLISVAAGDTVRWTVGDTTSGSGDGRRTHLLVKPFAPGLDTNLLISTDRRTYHLALESRDGEAMAGIAWTYPQDSLLALKRAEATAAAARPVASAIAVEQLNFNYAISGDLPSWRPVRAFDDGRQTFIEFPVAVSTGEAPPLFVLGETGDIQLLNYRMAGRYYVVDRLFGAAELRLGEKRQQIVRIVRGGTPKSRHRGKGA